MSDVHFYSNAPDRLQAAAFWLAESWRQKRRPVLVFVPELRLAEQLDDLLWTQEALSFIPHCRSDSVCVAHTPIVITTALPQESQDGMASCLLNLANTETASAVTTRFSEIIEIVSREDAVRLPARQRFRAYRELGHTVKNTDIAKGWTYA